MEDGRTFQLSPVEIPNRISPLYHRQASNSVKLEVIRKASQIYAPNTPIEEMGPSFGMMVLEDAGATHLYDETQGFVPIRIASRDLILTNLMRALVECDAEPEPLS